MIRLVNSVLFQAVQQRASDIHFEPFEKEIAIRYRIDGVLYNILAPPKRLQSSLISRIKIMAGMNIAEKRLPQDGRIGLKIGGREIDIRVSDVPTAHGERLVLRLLDKTSILLNLEDIGLSPSGLATMDQLIQMAHGIILVTGPTGSGKTTTLYAGLSKINSPDKNIITIEDPIEYQLKGIGQIQVNPKIQLTFASGLRSILRQDPDVIMVGEIRDTETAEIAIQASLTGHLVFSTLHTNDSAGAITRLLDMGIEPFLVSSSVVAIVAQRLVRQICPECRVSYRPTPEELGKLGIKQVSAQSGFLSGKGMRPLHQHRLPRPVGHLRDPRSRRRDPKPDPLQSRFVPDQSEGGRQGDVDFAGGRRAENPLRDDNDGRSTPGDAGGNLLDFGKSLRSSRWKSSGTIQYALVF
ncbi:MAG: ATPase, T2SS/T4P/T4SS family [Candidatus Manganitrophus sp.]|nr:ATPase, T2SS/T4P/T4SS family [Candidatus Manganitrophus sp.]